MCNVMLVFLLVAATGSALAGHIAKKTLLKITPDPELGDIEMNLVQRGKISTITVRNDDGELITTEILSEEGYEVEKPEGANVCYVRSLNEKEVDRNACVEEKLLAASEVPQAVAERCGDRPMYSLIQCENEGVGRSKRGCRVVCNYCGGVCCGVECSWSWK